MRITRNYVALSVMLVLIGCRSEPPNNKVANVAPVNQAPVNQVSANQAPVVAAKESPTEAAAPGDATVIPVLAVPAAAVASAPVPEGFPREIPLREAEAFLLKQKLSGQGCGSMRWNNQECGMFGNDYDGKILTPWLSKPVSLQSMYAQVSSTDIKRDINARVSNFLVELNLDGQVYYRDTPQQVNLVWKPTTDR